MPKHDGDGKGVLAITLALRLYQGDGKLISGDMVKSVVEVERYDVPITVPIELGRHERLLVTVRRDPNWVAVSRPHEETLWDRIVAWVLDRRYRWMVYTHLRGTSDKPQPTTHK